MGEERHVLVVDDHVVVTRMLGRFFSRSAIVTTAHSAAEARTALLSRQNWAGFVVDVRLPDGSGLDIVAEIRARFPAAPRMVLSGHADPEEINRAAALGAFYALKAGESEPLHSFRRRMVAQALVSPGPLLECVVAYADAHDFSDDQTRILTGAANGIQRKHLADSLGMSEAMLRWNIGVMTRLTGESQLGDIAVRALRGGLR